MAPTETRSAVVRARIEPELKAELLARAAELERSESYVVRQAIVEYLERQTAEEGRA